MSFSEENGYVPVTIDTMMLSVMENVNTQFGTTYTSDTFLGSNFYIFFYALIQKLQENEVKTSEIFLKLQQYFDITNEKIQRPVVTNPGLIEVLEASDFVASVKPITDSDAGKIFIAVDKDVEDGNWEDSDDYATDKLAVCTIIKDSTVAGAVTQGTESESIVLSNGQSFAFKYALPNRIDVHLKLTLTLSENNMVAIGDPDETKLKLLENIKSRYRLGKNFEPQRYFNTVDAPWAAVVLLEWSDDDEMTYQPDVYDSAFDDLFMISLERIHLVEA